MLAGGLDLVVALGPAAALGRRFAAGGRHETLSLHTLQRGVDRPDGDIPAGPFGDKEESCGEYAGLSRKLLYDLIGKAVGYDPGVDYLPYILRDNLPIINIMSLVRGVWKGAVSG